MSWCRLQVMEIMVPQLGQSQQPGQTMHSLQSTCTCTVPGPNALAPVPNDSARSTCRMSLFLLVLSLSPLPSLAPFPSSDPRAAFNFLIEPWWCKVPQFVR